MRATENGFYLTCRTASVPGDGIAIVTFFTTIDEAVAAFPFDAGGAGRRTSVTVRDAAVRASVGFVMDIAVAWAFVAFFGPFELAVSADGRLGAGFAGDQTFPFRLNLA